MLKTLVLGGGIGGVVASHILKEKMGSKMRVTVVDQNAEHYFPPSYPLLMIGQAKPDQTSCDFSFLQKKEIEFLQSEVIKLDLPARQVITREGSLEYDFLIISLGVKYHLETIPGFKEYAYNVYDFQGVQDINRRLQEFTSGSIVLFIASFPYKCPVAPYEIIFFLDQYWQERGLRDQIDLSVVIPDHSPEPLADPRIGQSIRDMLEEKSIRLITEASVLEVEENALILDHGLRIKSDLSLGIPSHWTPDVIRKTDIADENGFIKVDPQTLETSYSQVYAIGDCTALRFPVIGSYVPKAGVFTLAQADIVAQNIILLTRDKTPKHVYEGKGSCILNTGFGQARYSKVQYYKKPTPAISLLKPSKSAYLAKKAFAKYWFTHYV